MIRTLRMHSYALLSRLARRIDGLAAVAHPQSVQERVEAVRPEEEPTLRDEEVPPVAAPLETSKPGELPCWQCRVVLNGAMAAQGDAVYQRRLLRFLNLPPFYPGTRGPLCLLHTAMAVATDSGAIAAELKKRTAS
jgi:hypothetical protein